MAAPWIPPGARVLDVGTADGALFASLRERVRGGVGIDPEGVDANPRDGVRLIRGAFPQDAPREQFDAVTMLAVLEHFPEDVIDAVARGVAALLPPGGRLILTVPEPAVDRIVDALRRVHLLDGMEVDEHHGFAATGTRAIFEPRGFRLVAHRRFQLGLNNLYVFERFDGTPAPVLASREVKPRHSRWEDHPREQLAAGIERRFVYGEKAMLAQIHLKKGTTVPRHVHEAEQISYIVEGTLRLMLGEDGSQVFDVRAGEVLIIPSNVPHEALALDDVYDIDVFSPPRDDWIKGQDAYLRGR